MTGETPCTDGEDCGEQVSGQPVAAVSEITRDASPAEDIGPDGAAEVIRPVADVTNWWCSGRVGHNGPTRLSRPASALFPGTPDYRDS